MQVVYTKEQISDFEQFLQHEYLLTNGKGGYCSSTLLDCHTRKYHGLLVVPLPQLDAVYVLLSKIELSAIIGKTQFDFSVNEFPGNFFPKGYTYCEKIEMDYVPTMYYRAEDALIVKQILMPQNENTILVKYSVQEARKPIVLKLAPFLAYRNMHSLSNQNIEIRPRTYFETDGFKIEPYQNTPPLFMQTSKVSVFFPAPDWWKDFTYRKEMQRGYPYKEDLFCPGIFEVKLKKGESVILRGSCNPVQTKIETAWKTEETRIYQLKKSLVKDPEPIQTLKASVQQYITKNPNGIIAGYPWFGEWGRDTMISLAGCTLLHGNTRETQEILGAYAQYIKDGLLPNTLSPSRNFGYNTIDTPFLFIRAIQQYHAAGGDLNFIESRLLPAMISIIEPILGGSQPLAFLHENGLLYAGDQTTQLTWMDAQTASGPVTPRHGAAVEINALFYNALCYITESFTASLPEGFRETCLQAINTFSQSFEKLFWNEEAQCLADVFREENDIDRAIRPNQLFAIGLPYCCISEEKARTIIETVKQHLLTPYGLRTLSPQDSRYVAEYSGNQEKRDSSYHQGIVWPWLIGIYTDACLKFGRNISSMKKEIYNQFSLLFSSHLHEGCVYHVSELFDAADPFLPKGCPAQAWSAAELLRTIMLVTENV
ncbi:MAG: glycogen debranching enzyme family protein [Spirochaetales bacterium]|nr:glycogen debranching enzyme family protein [Spirochaetales bacterium]